MGMDLKDKKALVVGLGASGKESAAFLLDRGAKVSVSEASAFKDISSDKLAWVEENRIPLEAGGHNMQTFLAAGLIVVSPGVPLEIEPLQAAQRAGIPVIGEIELAARFIDTPVIAVTGTNGKSTTTKLIGHILAHAGKKVFVGGNIGRPLIGYAGQKQDRDFVVAEISSFQLDTTEFFRPWLGLLLNITEDHLDRYPSFNAYALSKFKIFANQTAGDFAVINGDDPVVMQYVSKIPSHILTFSHKPHREGAYPEGNRLLCRLDQEARETYSLEKVKLAGEHNLENIMAAVLAARVCVCAPSAIQEALETFEGLHHRTEFVCEIGGVSFYDDSKGTNVGSVVKSLAGVDRPVILIAGGRDKGGSYAVLEDPVRNKVKALILIGEAGEKIHQALGHLTRTMEAGTLPEAVRLAYAESAPGDVVLLSPACASFDMFRSYAERGDIFQEAARALLKKQGGGAI